MTADGLISKITNQFTGGDDIIGDPIYNQDGVVAYSPEQAQRIFKNLIAANVNNLPIPFLISASNGGRCRARRYQMTMHMMYHQHIAPEAIGIAVTIFHHTAAKNMADYEKKLRSAFGQQIGMSQFKNGFVSNLFDHHTAPTIRVYEDGQLSNYVLDPGICSKAVSIKKWADAQRQLVTERGVTGPYRDQPFKAAKNERLSVFHGMFDMSDHPIYSKDIECLSGNPSNIKCDVIALNE